MCLFYYEKDMPMLCVYPFGFFMLKAQGAVVQGVVRLA